MYTEFWAFICLTQDNKRKWMTEVSLPSIQKSKLLTQPLRNTQLLVP